MQGLTQHAEARMQQRGIRSTIVESLLDYGTIMYDHRGAALVFFDRKAKTRLLRNVGRARYRVMEKQLNTYAVVSHDGSVVTVGHRSKRIPRH